MNPSSYSTHAVTLAQVWDTETGRQLGPDLEGHLGAVCDLALTPDGRLLLSR